MKIEIDSLTTLIQVFNMRRSLAFYRDILGFEIASDSGDGDDSSWVWLRRGEINLMLNDQYEPGHVPPAPPLERTRWHDDTCLYFGCEDTDAAYEFLRGKRIELEPPKIASYGMKQLYFKDPDGYSICFQWPAGEGTKQMTRGDLQQLGRKALLSAEQNVDDYERLAQGVFDVYNSGDQQFRQHIQNRSKRVTAATGVPFDPDNFDIEMARAFIADEIGFKSWDELVDAVLKSSSGSRPIVFEYAIAAMSRGDFTALEEMVGADRFGETIIDWFEKGYFEGETETLHEIFAASCMLGHPRTVGYLLDHGVDPYAGMRTGLAGFHYAASSGRLDVIKLLIERGVPMEVKNMYGGTVFGQAMWSAVNEYTPQHAEIVERLVRAGAVVDEGYIEWWDEQNVPDAEAKSRIARVLREHQEFHERINAAKQKVDDAESDGSKRMLADSLKSLGDILRRPPFLRDAANKAFARAAVLYNELGLYLEEAWVKRHIGINHECADRLEEAEKYYDEALALYREHSTDDDGDYANAVRYPAVIKERLGKKDEAAKLWEEAHDRYAKIGPSGLGEGVAEAAAWLTILAIERGDLEAASSWFSKASEASSRSGDADTHKFIADVKERLEEAKNF